MRVCECEELIKVLLVSHLYEERGLYFHSLNWLWFLLAVTLFVPQMTLRGPPHLSLNTSAVAYRYVNLNGACLTIKGVVLIDQ